MAFSAGDLDVCAHKWPSGVAVLESPFVERGQLVGTPKVFAVTIIAFRPLRHLRVIALLHAKPFSNLSMATKAILLGNPTEGQVALGATVVIVQMGVGA